MAGFSQAAAGGERAWMAALLQRMAEPVLSSMAQGELHKTFPLELSPTWDGRDRRVAYVECFGRLIAGVAPWLALPEDNSAEGRVRKRLHALHQAVWRAPGNFTQDGFLTIGFAGHQPELGDRYSNNGSMYITSASFLALGLPENDSYWTGPAQDWTQKKAFAGQRFPKDYAVDY